MAKDFGIVIRSERSDAGAALSAVVSKLDAVLKIHSDARSALLRPGARRVRVSPTIMSVSSLYVVHADPDHSLSVGMHIPEIPAAYSGDYAIALRKLEPTFIETVQAAATRDLRRIMDLYPERVDQARVLSHIAYLADGMAVGPTIIEGLADRPLIFREEIASWAREAMPSANPEPITVNGVVKAGRLGEASKFQIFDGNRSVDVEPAGATLPEFSARFGKVVSISGTAQFRPDRSIRMVSDIEEVTQYTAKITHIRYRETDMQIRAPINLEIEADARGVEFIAHNEELGIYAFGRSLVDAIQSAQEEITDLWHSVGDAPIAELHDSALPLRRFLRKIIADENVGVK